MNIFVPKHREKFTVLKEAKLHSTNTWRFRNPVDKQDHSDLLKEKSSDKGFEITVPEGTIMEITSIRVIRSEYRNYISFTLYHDDYIGIQYKTVGKIKVDIFEDKHDGFKALEEMEVEIIDDSDN